MSIPAGYLEALRDRLSIAEVIGRRISFDPGKSVPAKGDYWACCPFHGEKTPSFHVHDRNGYFYCFGCHEKGSAIDFVMKHDRLGFVEAVTALAAEAGMAPPERDPREARREEKRKGLTDATEAATTYFREQLDSAKGRAARDYLRYRVLSDATIERFELGFAPDGREGALRALTGQGFDRETLVATDVVVRADGGDLYDRFRDRIIFPIRDARGRCIGFGGRALSPEAKAKYLNSRETELFKKSRSLYNYGRARAAVAPERPLLVVEGYMDVIALDQAGYQAAVAPLGTAVTEAQLQMLWRAADEPLLALDGDLAGQRAAEKAADLALPQLKPGKSLGFVRMPDGLDPDDLVRRSGIEALERLTAEALPLIDVVWRREKRSGPVDTPERKARLEAQLAALTARIEDQTVRRHYEYALRERRFRLFREVDGIGKPKDGDRGAGARRGAGFRGQPALGPSAEARAKALQEAAESGDVGVLREGAIVLLLLECAELLEERCDLVEQLDLMDPALDSVKNALLSAVAEDDQATREPDGAEAAAARPDALARFVDERCGAGASDALRGRLKARLGGPFAAPIRDAAAVSRLFDELVAMHRAQLTWRREIETYNAELIAGATEDAAPLRLQEAQKAVMRSQGGAEEGSASESELSKRLQSIVDAKPWIKRGRRG